MSSAKSSAGTSSARQRITRRDARADLEERGGETARDVTAQIVRRHRNRCTTSSRLYVNSTGSPRALTRKSAPRKASRLPAGTMRKKRGAAEAVEVAVVAKRDRH